MKFTNTIICSSEEIAKYNALLDLWSEEDGVINAGYDEDCIIACYTTVFDDGYFADIKICSGQENFFCDPVLFDANGYEACVLDCADSLDGEYEFEADGNIYEVIIKKEESK